MYIDSTSLSSPMEIETDGTMMDDVMMLKKTVEEEATQVITQCPLIVFSRKEKVLCCQ